ncbi:MAG: hypothetical protein K2Y08_00405 [Alphaproteobacteria bacterium]|nr:hypothetical protein [Alphaproteobacteria bacterium]
MKVEIMSFKPKTIARLAFALALSLAGCGNDSVPELTINSVSIYTDQDANQNSATAVDLVVIYDQTLVSRIGTMSASQYFSNTQQLLLDNPTLIDIWHWELVPGQVVQAFTPEAGETKAYAGYVFANYLTPGDHRIKIAPSGIISILLQKNDLLNLSTENLVAANPGTTMANAVRTPNSSQGFQGNLGTTTDAYSSCQTSCCGETPALPMPIPSNTATDVSNTPCGTTSPASNTPYGTMPSATPCGTTSPASNTSYGTTSSVSNTPCGTTSPVSNTPGTTPSTSNAPCGTTSSVSNIPCGSVAPPSSSSSTPQSGCTGQPVLKQPIPIATRPLKIPPALKRNNPGPKVKNG